MNEFIQPSKANANSPADHWFVDVGWRSSGPVRCSSQWWRIAVLLRPTRAAASSPRRYSRRRSDQRQAGGDCNLVVANAIRVESDSSDRGSEVVQVAGARWKGLQRRDLACRVGHLHPCELHIGGQVLDGATVVDLGIDVVGAGVVDGECDHAGDARPGKAF